MALIHLDFETFSEVDLKNQGLGRYAEDPSTEILLVGYSIDDGEVKCFEPWEKENLTELMTIIAKKDTLVCAHNFGFEKAIWSHVGQRMFNWPDITLDKWRCTAARARAMGLPGALAAGAEILGLSVLKDKKGDKLIQKYSKLVKGERNKLEGEDLDSFKDYCKTDVEVERELDLLLPDLIEEELKMMRLDSIINERGLPINRTLVEKAQELVENLTEGYENQSVELCGYKATQGKKVLEFLSKEGLDLENLQAATIEKAMLREGLSPKVKKFLEIRYESSRVGLKKLKKILLMITKEDRIKNSFMYHGATTGRWVSLGVQLQNFGKTSIEKQIEILKDVYLPAQAFKNKYERPMSALSQAIRGVISAPEGKTFIAADYSAIEARVLAWLSGESWLIKAYEDNKDVYVMMAASIYKIEESEIDGGKRFFGKQVILGAGYSMSHARFKDRCGDFGIKVSLIEAKSIINLYRESVPCIVKLWADLNKASLLAVSGRDEERVIKTNGCYFYVENNFLIIRLPSGRELHYFSPKIAGRNIIFKSFFAGKPVTNSLYGGKICQNICQAIARDLLMYGIFSAEEAGYEVVLHVHDDITALVDKDFGSLKEFEDLICEKPDWAEGLTLAAEGWEGDQWRK